MNPNDQGYRMRRAVLFSWVAFLGAGCAAAAPSPTVRDAIEFVHIQRSVAGDGGCATISPDGKRAVFVTWHGDLDRNTNVYELKVVDLLPGEPRLPTTLLTRTFAGDPANQAASPLSGVTFLPDGRTLAFLLRTETEPAQVWTLALDKGTLTQLTDHPTEVKSFVVGAGGQLVAFAAVARDEFEDQRRRFDEDGVFLWEDALFPFRRPLMRSQQALTKVEGRQIRQYFLGTESKSKLLFDSRWSTPKVLPDPESPEIATGNPGTLADEAILRGASSLTLSPHGDRLLLFPYALADDPVDSSAYAFYRKANQLFRRTAARYGVVDTKSGAIEALIDVPHPWSGRETGPPLWSPAGDFALIYSVNPTSPDDDPQWMEVSLPSRKVTSMQVPGGWMVLSWMQPGEEVLLQNGIKFATLRRTAGGTWEGFTELGSAVGFSANWPIAVRGRTVIGVRDGLESAPELCRFDLGSGSIEVLTDLNPQLRERTLARPELFEWQTTEDPKAEGFLLRPLAYQPGKRYPLVIYLDDGTLRRTGTPFIFDGVNQLSGFAAQVLASEGFVVLYTREPRWNGRMGTTAEGPLMQEHIEKAVAALDEAGLIDPRRIGISGWSRAGYYTHYLAIHAKIKFAAAITIDGGNVEYNERMRPFTDGELSRITTPLLFQPHGAGALLNPAFMAGRLAAMGKATEILWFKTASHSTTRPQHRFRSLDTHLDWWKFWLKDEESTDPAKAGQMRQWRRLREMRDADLKYTVEQRSMAAP